MLQFYYAGIKVHLKPGALHAFLCTDTELDTQTILEYYSKHWPIEIFFRQTKNNLGLNTYRVRSSKSIDRILLLIALTYLFCTMRTGSFCYLGESLISIRKETKRHRVEWIYQSAQNKVPIEVIFEQLNITQLL